MNTKNGKFDHITNIDYQNILDSFKITAICVITEEGHEILYYNQRAEEVVPNISVGITCHALCTRNCESCPINIIGDAEFAHSIRQNDSLDGIVDVNVTKILWHDSIPAFLMRIYPKFSGNTLVKSFVDIAEPIVTLPLYNESNELIKKNPAERGIAVGQYSERIYYLENPITLSENEHSIIDSLLLDNQGVGVIIGNFDENFSIRMISELAVKIIGYTNNYKEFWKDSGACLLNMVKNKHDVNDVRNKLLNPDGKIWSLCMQGKSGRTASVRIKNVIGTSPKGTKMWYLSIRQLGELEYDSITGGYNRTGFIQTMENMKTEGIELENYAILYVNIKGFKAVNKLYDSKGGDELLRHVYNYFNSSNIKPVIGARKESDHFLFMVKKEMIDLAEFTSLMKVEWNYGGRNNHIQCICGIYFIENEEKSIVHMIDCANLATEYIKDVYVMPFAVFDYCLMSAYLKRIGAISDFEDAIDKHEFKVYYQPIIDTKTEKIVSAEALVRWVTEDMKVIPPNAFIPVLEKNGHIVKLDRYVVQEVNKYLHMREQNNLPIVPVSVNLSRMDFFDEERIYQLLNLLKHDKLACKYMHFEITETSHSSVSERQVEFVEKVNNSGGMVYMDDFGVANSSMDMLAQYNFNILKIDMHFISQMVSKPKVLLLVEMAIIMAHRLNLKVIAEGVETKEQFDILRNNGCDYVQGYLFSKPLPKEKFDVFLMEHL